MLETTARFRLAGLFALDHAGIAGQESCLAQLGAKARLHFHKSPGDSELHRAGLTGHAAARHGNMKIQSGRTAGELEGRRGARAVQSDERTG